jgi:hypothetical protein
MQKQENPNVAMAETGLARLALGFLKIKKQNRDANIIAASNAKSGPLDIGFDIPKRKGLAVERHQVVSIDCANH